MVSGIRTRMALGVPAVLAFAIAWSWPAGATSKDSADPAGTADEYHYRMVGKIRPLLFWITRDDVGGARIIRRHAGDTLYLEFLIGSDPERSPRRINLWGYYAEEVRGAEARFVVLRSGSEEDGRQSYDDAEKAAQRAASRVGVMKGTVTATHTHVQSATIPADHELTYRDLDTALALIERQERWTTRRGTRPAYARPAMFAAIAELVERSVEAHRRTSGAKLSSHESILTYVFRDALYNLRLRNSRFLPTATFRDRTFTNVIQGDFDLVNRQTGGRTQFQIAYGTEGQLAHVPVHIVYRPNFWFEAELILDEKTRFAPMATK